jgi:hypothetical protein
MASVFMRAVDRPHALGGPEPGIVQGATQGEAISRAALRDIEPLPDSRLKRFAVTNLLRSPSEFRAVEEDAARRGSPATRAEGLIVAYGEASNDGACGNPRYAAPGIFE